MSQATTKSKTAKTAGEFAGAFDAFQMNIPSMEVPAMFREGAEKAVSQAKDAYTRMKSVAEEAGDVAEETYETARGHAVTVSLKALEITKSSADASFAFAKEVVGAKTFADAIELQTAFVKKQFDLFTAQMKDFQDIAQKAAVEVTKPSKVALEKAFKDYKVA